MSRILLMRVRIAALLGAVLVPGGVVLEVGLEPVRWTEFLALRCGFGFACFALFLACLRPRAVEMARTLSFLLGTSLAVGVEVLIFESGGTRSDYYAGQLVIVTALGLLFPWRVEDMAGATLAVCAVYLVPLLFEEGFDGKELFAHAYFMLNNAVIAMVGSHLATRLREKEFLARAELERRTAELQQATDNLGRALERQKDLDRAKNQFFANVSHELRTPLTVILASAELLEQEYGGAGSSASHLEVLRRSAASLLRLIDDLLDLARLDADRASLVLAAVDVAALLEGLRVQFSPLAARKQVQVALELLSPPVPPVAGDVARLETVFRNLLSNAVKFSPEGGQIALRVRAAGDGVEVEVADHGPGIPVEHRERVFERFVRLDAAEANAVQGTGIGLALVKELVDLHSGEVTVASNAPTGSVFRVRLPCGDVARLPARRVALPFPAAEVADPAEPARAVAPEARLLVIEDNDELRALLDRLLAPRYAVSLAADGEAGLAKALAEAPDLVVTDLMLPRRNGYEVVRALKKGERTRGIPVIALTALRGPELAADVLGVGADDYVAKPFHSRELLARIHAQLRLVSMARELAHHQKLAMLGTLSAGLAHEVRNPVNAIVNSVPLVRAALTDRSNVAGALELVEVISDSAWRMNRICNDLLTFAHRREADRAEWRPADAVESSLKLLAARAAGVNVQVDVPRALRVEGFPDRPNQAVLNVLDNALRAAGPRGEVRVRAEGGGGAVRLAIADNGPGIGAAVLPRLFDPFFTTRDVGSGTGLGLHLTRQIIEGHGGRVDVESSPGAGATFTLTLPERWSPPRARESTAQAAAGGEGEAAEAPRRA